MPRFIDPKNLFNLEFAKNLEVGYEEFPEQDYEPYFGKLIPDEVNPELVERFKNDLRSLTEDIFYRGQDDGIATSLLNQMGLSCEFTALILPMNEISNIVTQYEAEKRYEQLKEFFIQEAISTVPCFYVKGQSNGTNLGMAWYTKNIFPMLVDQKKTIDMPK